MSDLAALIKERMATELVDGDPHRVYVSAIETVLEDHAEFPAGWCLCGKDYPCSTVRGLAAALGVREDGE